MRCSFISIISNLCLCKEHTVVLQLHSGHGGGSRRLLSSRLMLEMEEALGQNQLCLNLHPQLGEIPNLTSSQLGGHRQPSVHWFPRTSQGTVQWPVL